MSPAILSALVTLLLVGGPLSVWIARLHLDLVRLDDLLDASALREKTQRARAVAAELALAGMRRKLAEAWQRVARAEGWGPGGMPDEAPTSRPASPPPESRRGA